MSAEQLVVLGIVERTVWWRWQRQKRDGMDLGGVRRGEVKTVNTELSVNDTGNEENEREDTASAQRTHRVGEQRGEE